MRRKKELEFKKEFYAMRRRLLAKGYGLFLTRRLVENALCENYGKRFAKKMLKSLVGGSGDISA